MAQENGKKGRLTGKKHAAHLKKLLGMTERPTAAGQEKFGDVDVDGTGFPRKSGYSRTERGWGGGHNYVIPPATDEQRKRILGAIGRPLKRMGRGALKMAKRAAGR
jgi:hypothetical protein